MANDPLGTVQPGTAPSVQSPQLQRNLQDPDYLFYNLLNSGKFSQAGKEHYEKRRREKLVEQVGYEPTFWENPTRVARYYNAIQNAPTDWKKPDWLDPEAVKTAYDYYKFRNEDKPWYTWKYLPTDDPGRAYMQSLGQPPNDPEYILDQYLGGLPLQEYEQPTLPDEPTTAETLTSTWKDLPDWQKFFLTIGMPTGGIEGRPELSRFAAAGAQGGLAAMGGAAIGSALLPGVGTVVGALALGVPTGIMSYFGSPYVPVLSDLLNIFNVPAMAAMQTLGVGKQVVGSITDAERFGSFSELLNDMPEAWEASKATYMTQPNWLFDAAALLSGDEAAGPGKVWQFQKGITEPVAVDDIRTDALVDYRRRMAAGENDADLYSEYVDKYGFSGTFNDFLLQSIIDPLQLSPYVSSRLGTKITGAIGKQTGNLGIQRLSKTFEAGQGSLLVDLMPMGLNYLVGKLTGKVGSQGLIDTWRTYQNNIRRNFPTAGIEPRPPSELSAFEKFAANLTPEGRYKELEPRVQRKGLAGWTDYLTNLTNDSKARLFLFGMHDNLGALLNEAKGDPVRMNKLIDLVSQPEPADVGEAAAGLINSPMAATIQAAVREVVREGTPARMLADWTQNEPNRNLLLRVADATGMTPAKTLEAIGKDPALFAQDLLRRSAERPQIQDLVREFQIGSLDQTTAIQIGNILRDRLGVFMGEHPAAWHPDEYQANLVKHIFDQSDGWLKTRFDLKPEAGVFRLSGVLKSLQSLVLLGLNPAYFINNAVNNIVTRASQGVFGYMTTKQINDYWTRMGFEPGRLGVGIGAAGEGAISSGLDAVGRLTAGGGLLGKAQKTLGQLNKLGVFSRLSSKFEGFESRQSYTIGAMRFMQRNWKRNIGFNALDAGLEARLRAVHPQMPEIIYGIVEAGLNPNEITGKILQGAIVRDVSNYIDGAAQRLYPNNPQLAKDLLNTLNISGELSRRLQGATTREAVNRAFADTEAQIQDWIDLRVAQGLADQAANAEAQVRSAGVAAVLPMFTDMIERNMYGWLTHSNGWQEVFTETANMTPGERGARIQAYSSQTAAEWRRMHSFERQTYQGIHRALGIQDATAAEFMRLMDGEHKLWETFYDGVDVVTNGVTAHTAGINDLYREFFSRDYESYEARQVAWDTLQQRLNEMYEAAVQRERTIELAMDDEYVGLWERFTGRDASDLLLHRENVRAIRDEMTNAMMAFRQNLRDTNPSLDVRRLMWTEFVENTYRPLIMRLKQTEIIGASRLAGQEPPLMNPPDEPGQGAAPQTLDFPPPLEPPSIGQVAAQPIPQTPAQMIRNIAHRYGVPTADVRGRPLDIVIKRIVRKYGGQEFDRIADIPPDLAEQAFIARQEANANPVVERAEIDVTDHIDGQHGNVQAEAAADIAADRAAGRLNRRMARDLFLSAFNDIPEADVDWIMFMVDQHADTWAVEHGYEPSPASRDLWWATHLEDVRRIATRPPDNSLTQRGKPRQGSFFEENFEDMPLFSGTPETVQTEVFAPGEGSGTLIRSNTVRVGRDVFEVVLEDRPTGIAYYVRKNGAKVLPGETRYLPQTVQDIGVKMVDSENINRGVQPMLFQPAEAIGTTKFDTWFTYDFLNDRPGNVRSAVVNEDGSPKVVYHGSPRMDFEAFDPEKSKLGLYGKGFYFTEDLEVATGYANIETYGDVQRGVIDAHLSVHNPFDIDAVYSFEDAEAIVGHSLQDRYIGNTFSGQAIYDELMFDGANEYVEIHHGQKTYDAGTEYGKQYATNALMDGGFDGITHIGGRLVGDRLHRVWIAFDPRQVKTTNNNGGWSTSDPRMLYQPAAEGETPKPETQRQPRVLTREETKRLNALIENNEAWNITLTEYLDKTFTGLPKDARAAVLSGDPGFASWESIRQQATAWHKKEVELALTEGKPVPQEVLADYPDLKPEPQAEAQPKPAEQANEPLSIEMIEIGNEVAGLEGNPQELLRRMDTALEQMQKNLKAMPDNDGLAAGIEALQMKRDAIAEGRPYKVVDTKLPVPDVPDVDVNAQLAKAGYVNSEIKNMPPAEAQAEAQRIFNAEPEPNIAREATRVPMGITRAYGPDPNKAYDFRWKVVELDQLVTSHGLDGNVNKAFPAELQRVQKMRGRAASQEQITNIAGKLVPASILGESNSIQTGAMIVGPDNVVESGNGRTLALRLSIENFPEKWAEYQAAAKLRAAELGLNLEGYNKPVIVRERVSDVDRTVFFREANDPTTLRASEFEQAVFDSNNLSDDAIINLGVNPEWTIDQALRAVSNDAFVRSFVASLPENERGVMVDKNGMLSAEGLRRIKNAIFLKIYQGDAGFRVAQGFIESIDPLIKNVQNALYATLPVIGKLESSVRKGAIPKNLSISGDIIRVADRMLSLAKNGTSVKNYLTNYQGGLMGDDLTPIQLGLLRYIHENAKQATRVRKLLEEYAVSALQQPGGGQSALMPIEEVSKGTILDMAASKLGKDTEFAEAETLFTEKGAVDETNRTEVEEAAVSESEPTPPSEPAKAEVPAEVARGQAEASVTKMKLPDRGGVVFRRDGRAIINAFEGSDASTLIHELGHIFRRDLAPELLDVVAKSTGLKNGAELSALEEAFWFGEDGKVYQEYQRLVKIEKPTAAERRRITAMENSDAVKNMKRYIASEEHFAHGWERYMAEGVAPTPELRTAFERFSNWLLKIYTRIINTNLDVEVNVKINGVSLKDVYDRMLTVRPPENPSLFGDGATRTVNTTPGVDADAPFRELMNGGYHIESVPTEPRWEVTDNQRVLRFADDAIVRIIPDKDGTYSVEGYGGAHKGFTSEASASLFAQFIAPERIYVLYDPAGTAIKQFVNYDFLASAAGETYGLIKVPNEFVPFAEGVIQAASEKNDYFVYRGMNRGEMDANTLTPDNFRPSPERPVYVVEVLRGRTDYENNRIYTFDAIPVDRIMRVTEIRVQPDGGREYVNVTDIFKDSLDPGRMLFQRATPMFEQVDPFMHGQNQITGRFAVGGTVVAYAPRGLTAPQPLEAGGRTVYLLGIDPDNPALWVAQDGDNIITIPMRDPLNPVPEPSPVGDTQLRNVPTIENEGVALHDLNIDNVMPLMREIKDGVLRDIDSQPLSLGDVSEADQGQVRAWLNRTMGDLASAKLAAAGYGELQRDASLLNYTKRYGADNVTNMFWPYSLWGTRSIQEWAYRMLDKPTLFGLYARYEEMRRKTETEKNGFPSRFKGKMALGLPFLPDYMGQLGFFDPIRQLFPPKAIVGSTLDFLVQEKDRQAGAAVGILYQMVETGEITPAEADEANKTRAGEAWTAAYQRAAEEQDTRFNNPIDVVNNLFSPALWWSIPNNILQGTPEKTNPLPVTRFGQTLQYATQGTWLEGAGAVAGGLLAGPERAIRKKSGLSEFGEWGDYYVDRWLANMAADGTFSTKDVLLALTERRGPAFEEAYKRAGQEQAFRMPGGVMLYGLTHGMAAKDVGPTVLASLFPLGLFPPGELKQRGLQDDYKKAQDAYYNKGQEDALNQFFKDHPEYEARLALWDKPEERLRQFLVSEIWDAYYKLERPNRSKAVDQLGPTFEKTFLNDGTRDYSGLRVDQLAAWAKILKGVVPVVPETKAVDDMGFLLPELDLYPPELAKAIEIFQNERDRLYPGWFMLQSAYYNLPNEKRAGYMTRFPLLKKYQDWRKKYEKDHPELKPWFDEQRAKYNTGGTSSGGGSRGGSTAPQKQPVEKQVLTRSDLRLFSSPLLRQLTSYFLGNVSMGEGAWAELDNIWNKMGRPNGDMNTWLSTVVIQSFQ